MLHVSPQVLDDSRELDRAVERLTRAHTETMLSLADGKVDFCVSMLEAVTPHLLAEARSDTAMGVMLATLKFYMLSVKSSAGQVPS